MRLVDVPVADWAFVIGVNVWGVTTHHPILIAKWQEEHGFGVPILADVTGDVARAYVGLYGEEIWPGLRHTARRGVIGIDVDQGADPAILEKLLALGDLVVHRQGQQRVVLRRLSDAG